MLELFWLSVVTLALWLLLGGWWAQGVSRMAKLDQIALSQPEAWPRVAIVVPARNEAGGIEGAMQSLLALDYPHFEVVAVDDRSEDATGAILDRLAADHERLRVIHVDSLPERWLGKTHAMQRGADATSAPWLLFTDADVHFRSDALRRAVAFALTRERDHVAALPRFVASGPLVGAFMGAFALLFSLYTRLWSAPDPSSGAAIGIGAFGLVRREAYAQIGGHHAVRMRPDDDLALGQALKSSGASQEAVFAADLVAVAWYPTVWDAVRGMRKNAFAGFGFSAPFTVGTVIALLVTSVLPYAAIFLTAGLTRWLYVAVVIVIAAVYTYNWRFTGHAPAYALLHPVGVAFLCWAALASMIHTLRSGGLEWRGTHYKLEDLERGRSSSRRSEP